MAGGSASERAPSCHRCCSTTLRRWRSRSGCGSAPRCPISGIEEISVRALSKLEQVLPSHLRRRIDALSSATSALSVGGPQIDTETLATLAAACRDTVQVHFAYVARDGAGSARTVKPAAVVYSGLHWYLVAFDLDREDWRTFRIDRIDSTLRPGRRGTRRRVPGGDPAAYVQRQLSRQRADEETSAAGRIRVLAPLARVSGRVPAHYASVVGDGPGACIIETQRPLVAPLPSVDRDA